MQDIICMGFNFGRWIVKDYRKVRKVEMTLEEMKAWHDEKMRDLAETETRLRGYLHQLENTPNGDVRLFENPEILLGMQCFALAISHVAQFVSRQYEAFKEMGEAQGSA